ncbi:MAG: heme anaerobic degradation radical SAM methyltransferase ChuW/HutW [Mailhella sp.]|nr:heme anaerobic degradation radical SAM methyltransferase ChuW/HutW [Mailhella sp.]
MSSENTDWNIEKYYAAEDTDPLSGAFAGKIAVHPGAGGKRVPPADLMGKLDALSLSPRSGLSTAYIHVPFCETHCLYCGFYPGTYHRDQSARYTDTLIRELQLWAGRPAQEQGPVHAVYFGGGTPTALEAPDLERLLKAVRQHLPLANDCEMTVEGRLHSFGPEKMEACLAGGANRFSLGVQSFTTKIRQSMGRIASRETVEKRLSQLMSYGQAAVIVDLIFGFPNQTLDIWLNDIQAAMDMRLDGLDCYQLNVFGQTPLAKAIKEGRLPHAADTAMQSAMFAAGVEKLSKASYSRISLTHWARTSRERNLYNQYVKGSANCLAFGPGAGGNLDGWFFMNQADYGKWMESVNGGTKPAMMLVEPSPFFRLYRDVAYGLEHGRIDFGGLDGTFGTSTWNLIVPLLEQWERAGLVTVSGRTASLTLAGQFWQVNISQLMQDFLKHFLEGNTPSAMSGLGTPR